MADDKRVPEPPEGDARSVLLGWLAFHRNALEAKCAGLDADQLVERSAPPSPLSLLGLVRHLTEMERAYGAWALGPKSELRWVWGDYTDGGPEWDIDADASMLEESMAAWARERAVTDERIAAHATLDSIGGGNGYSIGWNVQKLVGEYAPAQRTRRPHTRTYRRPDRRVARLHVQVTSGAGLTMLAHPSHRAHRTPRPNDVLGPSAPAPYRHLRVGCIAKTSGVAAADPATERRRRRR